MAAVDIFDVKVLDNPAMFTTPLQFQITYEVRETLKEDIEWKVIYVGSAEDKSHDQELAAALLPADTVGRFAFILKVDPPDASIIPVGDILGATVVLLTCMYKDAEFLRVGYYLNNEYVEPEMNENPPAKPDISKIRRTIADKEARVTKFPHRFDFHASEFDTFPHPELVPEMSEMSKDTSEEDAGNDYTAEVG